jgi:hypothetical protein
MKRAPLLIDALLKEFERRIWKEEEDLLFQ